MAERKRLTGFMLADAAFAADPKFLRLARNSPSSVAYATAVGVFWLVLADARRARNPEVNWEEYEDYAEQIAMLQAVRLFTPTGFHPIPFEKYAPVYQSPFDRERSKKGEAVSATTQDDTKEHAVTQVDTHIGWAELDSSKSLLPTNKEESLRETNDLPGEDDSATAACRLFLNGGEWLGNKEYVAAWDDMDRRFTAEWVQDAIQPAYAEIGKSHDKVRPWDLKRMVELRCAERTRAEELEREHLEAKRAAAEEEGRQKRAASMSAEERERQSLYRKATGIWSKGGMKGMVPKDEDELRRWVAANENPA